NEVYLPDEFIVSGIFSFGKYDFDSNIIFVNRDDANDLFEMPWGSASAVYVWTPNPFDLDGIVKKLSRELRGMDIKSWQEINRNLLGVLQMEKNMMFFLLIFIVLVAAFSITNTLITVVVQKTREIGLLRSLGASSGTIMSVFILQGFFVGLIGTVLGTALGITVIYFRNNILDFMSQVAKRPLFPPEFYFFNQLPAHITWHDLLLIGLISIILCTLGAVIPAWRAARLTPAEALRYE
ncbi:MAG: FtsX-like permease family protein, partial [Victivallales bacterium]|nr:FtsX-like permease family protein [Victivallales bacterium]